MSQKDARTKLAYEIYVRAISRRMVHSYQSAIKISLPKDSESKEAAGYSFKAADAFIRESAKYNDGGNNEETDVT